MRGGHPRRRPCEDRGDAAPSQGLPAALGSRRGLGVGEREGSIPAGLGRSLVLRTFGLQSHARGALSCPQPPAPSTSLQQPENATADSRCGRRSPGRASRVHRSAVSRKRPARSRASTSPRGPIATPSRMKVAQPNALLSYRWPVRLAVVPAPPDGGTKWGTFRSVSHQLGSRAAPQVSVMCTPTTGSIPFKTRRLIISPDASVPCPEAGATASALQAWPGVCLGLEGGRRRGHVCLETGRPGREACSALLDPTASASPSASRVF